MSDDHRDDHSDVPRRRVLGAAGAVASLGLAGCVGTPESTTTGTGANTATDTVIDDRVADLSLREKAGQMTLAALNGRADRSTVEGLMADPGLGGVLYGAANPDSFDARDVATQLNDYQRTSTEQTAHGTPLLVGIDAVHGNATVSEAVVFPHNVGMGATWRPHLVRERARVTSRSLRATGVNWNYAPVADRLYDPRWGRFYEGFHEAPSAVSQFVTASVEGLQADDEGTARVGSSVKHFAGYAMADAGNDRDNARIPERDLREQVFPPFVAGIESGAATVMANSGGLNGVPAYASEWLQRTVLREEMGFEGVLVSDWGDIQNLAYNHAYLDWTQFGEGARVLVAAGIDMYMASANPGQFIDAVVTHVEDGRLPEARIDEAVARILRTKERLGLMDDPTVDVASVGDRIVTERDHKLAQEAAEGSMTLLEQGVLPLEDPDTVLVTGPNADAPRAQHGGWTLGWQGLAGGTTPPTTTIVEGIREYASAATTVEHVPTGREELTNRATVAEAAADADVVIAVVGEGAYAETEGDTDDLRLPAAQRELLATLADTAGPTVGVVVAGRPRGGDHLFDATDGVLMAYLPGSKGGQAVGKAVFGARNPGGRLPFTWPNETGSVPVSLTKRGLTPGASRFPVGHGETYTGFEVGYPVMSPSTVDPRTTDDVTITYPVTNTGDRRGDYVAVGSAFRFGTEPTTTPWPRLTDFRRVSLEPGEQREVSVSLPLERLAAFDGDVAGGGEWVIPAGTVYVDIESRRLEGQITDTVPLAER